MRGASIVSVPPWLEPIVPSESTAWGNCGVLSTKKPPPLIVGYRPSELRTYQADIVPRSSLPVSPSGPFVNSVSAARMSVAVFHGSPVQA